MKRIINPWTEIENYNCFACSENNPLGLKMEFYEDEEDIVCIWQPKHIYQGYTNILHGGIQATLLDEMGAWVVARKLQTEGFTSKLLVKYIKPVEINQNPIIIRARLKELKHHIAFINASISNQKNEICATAELCYYCTPAEKSNQDYQFGGCIVEQ